jgi:hypothetical protein
MAVLTGVSTAEDLLAAPVEARPTLIGRDLADLFGAPSSGGWQVTRHDAELRLTGDGSPIQALRALCALAWQEPAPAGVRAGNDAAVSALRTLGVAAKPDDE